MKHTTPPYDSEERARYPESISARRETQDPVVQNPDYWLSLITEKPAADYLDVTTRTMQTMRQRGDGPRYRRISARCIRYTRADLKAWADSRMRTSTSDPGHAAA